MNSIFDSYRNRRDRFGALLVERSSSDNVQKVRSPVGEQRLAVGFVDFEQPITGRGTSMVAVRTKELIFVS